MNKLRWKIENFMRGRNGLDELGRDVTIVSMVLYVISVFVQSSLLYLISLIGMTYEVYRVFSRNIFKRQLENSNYMEAKNKYKFRLKQHKTHRFFKCKGCGKKIRVPRGKGKVEITCPVCGNKIIRRT